jgi:hypothetical protein
MGAEFQFHEVTALADALTKASAPARADVEAVVFGARSRSRRTPSGGSPVTGAGGG